MPWPVQKFLLRPDAEKDVQAGLDAQQGKLGLIDKNLPAANQENPVVSKLGS